MSVTVDNKALKDMNHNGCIVKKWFHNGVLVWQRTTASSANINTSFWINPKVRWGCGHFLEPAKPPNQGFSCTPTSSCFQGISLSAFRYTMPDIHSVCQ